MTASDNHLHVMSESDPITIRQLLEILKMVPYEYMDEQVEICFHEGGSAFGEEVYGIRLYTDHVNRPWLELGDEGFRDWMKEVGYTNTVGEESESQ